MAQMIEIQKSVFGYPGVPLFTSFDLTIMDREVVAVVGRSGVGKTTILKTISGEIPLLSGKVLLDGESRDSAWLARHVSRTLQSFPLLHWLTVLQNLELSARLRGVDGVDLQHVLKEFAADHIQDRYPKGLSGGERCRASLAQAALIEPRALLLDEPFNGLDLYVKEEIAQRLFSFTEKFGSSIIFVTHDLYDACVYADKVVVLEGKHPARIGGVVDTSSPDSQAQVREMLMPQEDRHVEH